LLAQAIGSLPDENTVRKK